jgi:3-dehydroquinate dehydratase-2
MPKLITILNGPNLNLLGRREPEIYGHATLMDVEADCKSVANEFGLTCELKQSNVEGELVDMIQTCRETSAGIIINPAAYTHTSVAILDALNTFDGPVLEIHISNLHRREDFRQISYVSKRANASIVGMGVDGYSLCMRHMCNLLTK